MSEIIINNLSWWYGNGPHDSPGLYVSMILASIAYVILLIGISWAGEFHDHKGSIEFHLVVMLAIFCFVGGALFWLTYPVALVSCFLWLISTLSYIMGRKCNGNN